MTVRSTIGDSGTGPVRLGYEDLCRRLDEVSTRSGGFLDLLTDLYGPPGAIVAGSDLRRALARRGLDAAIRSVASARDLLEDLDSVWSVPDGDGFMVELHFSQAHTLVEETPMGRVKITVRPKVGWRRKRRADTSTTARPKGSGSPSSRSSAARKRSTNRSRPTACTATRSPPVR